MFTNRIALATASALLATTVGGCAFGPPTARQPADSGAEQARVAPQGDRDAPADADADDSQAEPASGSAAGAAADKTVTLKGGSAARHASITLPASLYAGQTFSATAEGETGPGGGGGGFIFSAYLLGGGPAKAACPAHNPISAPEGSAAFRSVTELPSGNVFVAGPFLSAVRSVTPDEPGTYRACAYLTTGSDSSSGRMDDTVIVDRTIEIAPRPEGIEAKFMRPGTVNGTYLATPDDIVGGGSNTRLELEIVGHGERQRFKSIAGTGMRETVCDDHAPQPSSTGFLFYTDEPDAGGTSIYTNTFSSQFKTDLSVVGGTAGDNEIRGTFSFRLPNGCKGSVGFTAHRQPEGAPTIGDGVQAVGN